MIRVFSPDANLNSGALQITGLDFHHLVHVLRVNIGDEIVVLDNRCSARQAIIVTIGKASLEVDLGAMVELPPEPSIKVTVAQALGKGDKFEQVIQHGTEIGAHAFIPLITSRNVIKLDRKSEPEKLARWVKVAKGAAEQCGRGRIPEILGYATLPELCNRFADFDAVHLLQADGAPLSAQCKKRNVLVIVGPEGGLVLEEVRLASTSGAFTRSLGPYTLRTETAALVALSRLLA
jgi:16S rRNA (uracil1498-N3)-methyltransferase